MGAAGLVPYPGRSRQEVPGTGRSPGRRTQEVIGMARPTSAGRRAQASVAGPLLRFVGSL